MTKTLCLKFLFFNCYRGSKQVIIYTDCNIYSYIYTYMYSYRLIVVQSKHCCTTEQTIVHVHFAGVVVSIRVPETSWTHPHSLAPLLSYHYLYHYLVPGKGGIIINIGRLIENKWTVDLTINLAILPPCLQFRPDNLLCIVNYLLAFIYK